MSITERGATSKVAPVDQAKLCESKFTLTFAVEVPSLEDQEVWQDSTEGWINEGPCSQGLKLQCVLYPGQTFDLDIMMWPQVAKIWCGANYGFVRTWRFLERRWLAFSISFVFPVRVVDLHGHITTITPNFGIGAFGGNAKGDKNIQVYLPPLSFGMRRYFAPVLETETESIFVFAKKMVWEIIERFIPKSIFDELFEIPHEVKDIRHQDACLDKVRDFILCEHEPVEIEVEPPEVEEDTKKQKLNKRESKVPKVVPPKEKEKKKPDVNFALRLPGESILSGTGRIVLFETVGERPPDSPQIIVLISSNNLPAQDDLPIVFLNVENLIQIPLNEFKILRITQLYIKWKVGEKEHCSEPQTLKNKTTINFNDHRAFPVPYELLPKVTSEFLDTCFKIELRGIRSPAAPKEPRLFGYEKGDRDFERTIPKLVHEELDLIIAVTKINGRCLAKGINAFLTGEYPLYPPRVTAKLPQREVYCTNDINAIRMPVEPDLIVRPHIVLQAQMTLEVSIGVVGCIPRSLPECYSRMFCTIKDSETVLAILRNITAINDEIIMLLEKRDNLMSGFALDTGNVVVLYLEGPRDGHILRIWDMTEDYYPKVKPVFSCSDRYSTRIYPDMIEAAVPFIVLKMYVPLGILLACPPVYARPALPLPTRSAVIKLCGLISHEWHSFPSRCQMPTSAELKSFKLELCAAPRPTPVVINDDALTTQDLAHNSQQSVVSRINWDKIPPT